MSASDSPKDPEVIGSEVREQLTRVQIYLEREIEALVQAFGGPNGAQSTEARRAAIADILGGMPEPLATAATALISIPRGRPGAIGGAPSRRRKRWTLQMEDEWLLAVEEAFYAHNPGYEEPDFYRVMSTQLRRWQQKRKAQWAPTRVDLKKVKWTSTPPPPFETEKDTTEFVAARPKYSERITAEKKAEEEIHNRLASAIATEQLLDPRSIAKRMNEASRRLGIARPRPRSNPEFEEWLQDLRKEPKIAKVGKWKPVDFRWPYAIGLSPGDAISFAISFNRLTDDKARNALCDRTLKKVGRKA